MASFSALSDFLTFGADTIIDVRSPSEFAEDHVPGALNLPVLNDAERAEVGTIYKQMSPFRARKIGVAMVFRNAAKHIETTLADEEGGWRPLVYCWRGGQRSGAFAWMLREIGWRADVIEGGYRSFRRLVSTALYDTPLPHRLVKLGGYTGTAKTELLGLAAAAGAQVIDLEGLACHRGSVLGAMNTPQPSQKSFETALAFALEKLDPARPVLVEAESSKIGGITLPPSLWARMKEAPVIEIEAPVAARARYLADAYAAVLEDHDTLMEKLAPLRRVRGREMVEEWGALSKAGDHVALCQSLAEGHYDPAYRRARKGRGETTVIQIGLADLAPRDLEDAAARLVAYLDEDQSTRPMAAPVMPAVAS